MPMNKQSIHKPMNKISKQLRGGGQDYFIPTISQIEYRTNRFFEKHTSSWPEKAYFQKVAMTSVLYYELLCSQQQAATFMHVSKSTVGRYLASHGVIKDWPKYKDIREKVFQYMTNPEPLGSIFYNIRYNI